MIRHTYSLIGTEPHKWNGMEEGSIKFKTNNKALYEAVSNFVKMAADALSYRNHIMKVYEIELKDEEEK